MLTTPAHQGAGTDESTGRELWQIRPADTLEGVSSCASFSNAERNQLYSLSGSCESSSRILSTSSCFEIASTEIAVSLLASRKAVVEIGSWSSQTESTVIAMGGAVLGGAEAVAGANGDRNTGGSGGLPPTRPAACRRSDPPDHRQRVCGGGGCAVRTLHLWAAMLRTATNHRLKRSILIGRVSA